MSQLTLRFSVVEKNDRGQEVELVRKALQFKPQTTVVDACEDLRKKLTEIKGLGPAAQYGLFLADDDPKRGVWLDSGRTLEHYLLRENDTLEYRKKMRLLKVRMLDGAIKAIMVDDSQIVSNMMVIICTKIGITNHDEYSLVREKTEDEENQAPNKKYGTLGTIGGTLTLKRKHKTNDPDEPQIDPKMATLRKNLHTEDGVNWVDHGKTLREQGIDETEILLLRRKYFYSDANVDARDPVQLNLLYEQAKEAILDGTHPVPLETAVQFGAIQVQIQFGDHKEDKHKPGMLADLKEFLPLSFMKVRNVEKKIFSEHRSLMGTSEIDSKYKYVKLARGLPTFGVHFFLVKEKQKGRNKLVPRLLGVTKDSVLRLDEKTKEILKTWPLTTVRRWAASPNVFTLDFGDYQDQYYSVQTTEGEQISALIAGYIDIILKRRQRKERFGEDGNEEEYLEESFIHPGRAIEIHGLPQTLKKAKPDSLAKPGLLRNSGAQDVVHNNHMSKTVIYSNGSQNGGFDPGAQYPEKFQVMSEPQRALISTISAGQDAIDSASSLLNEKAKLPPLGNDPASVKWKETQWNTNQQAVHSQVSAMNAATAQMVTLTGQDSTDHNAVGAAVNTISTNLPDMAREVKMLAALMDDKGVEGDDLMGAAKTLCGAFSDMLSSAAPQTTEPRQTLLSAASRVGEASDRVLYTIGEEDDQDRSRKDLVLGLAKAVANSTAALVLKAKNVASECEHYNQNRVINAATQCALNTSQLVACAKVVAPTIADPLCQDQLMEAARDVAKSVEGCVSECRDVCSRDDNSLQELGGAAQDVTKALNDLLNQIKDGGPDKIPDIMDMIMVASGELIASHDSQDMVRQARILAQATAELIQSIKGDAESQTDSDLQKRLLSAAKALADATADMVEAAKRCASSPNNESSQDQLKRAADHIRATTSEAVGATIKRKMIKRLENSSKHAAATATQCIAASQGAGLHNTSHASQDELMESCKSVADVIPKLVEGVKYSMQNPNSAMAQLNLITNAERFTNPASVLIDSTRSALPTVENQSASIQLQNASKQLDNALTELKSCIKKAHAACGSLEMEASADLIHSLESELNEFLASASSMTLRPLPGESSQTTSVQLNTASRAVGSTVAQLLTAASEGNRDITNRAARDTANALRDFTAAVRGVAATSNDKKSQHSVIMMAKDVMLKSAKLVIEAQKAMNNYSDQNKSYTLATAGKEVSSALNKTMQCVPGQQEVEDTISNLNNLATQINSARFPKSGRPYGELQSQLNHAADQLTDATSEVVQTAPNPTQLASTTRHFGEVLGNMMECSMDMAGQTSMGETKTQMVSTMMSVTSVSSTFLSSAKSVAIDPKAPNAKNNLATAARGVTEAINNLINVYTSAAPGQKECDSAIRAIQSAKHMLENPTESVSDSSYYECLDNVMEKSKALGDGMTGIANHAKKSEHEEFGSAVKEVASAIVGLIEAASQATYLVGVSDPTSVAGRRGLLDQTNFMRASQEIKRACHVLTVSNSTQQQILSAATVIAKHTSSLCNACRLASSKTSNPVAKRHFVQSAKDVANATAILVKEIKRLDSNYCDENRAACAASTQPLIEAVDNLCQFASSPEFASVPGKISDEGIEAQKPILESGKQIIDGSCAMIHSAKSLAVNPKDPPTWQALANSSKAVSDSIKRLVSSLRDKAPGQKECDDAIEKLTIYIRELDQSSLAAINQNLSPRKNKDIKQFTEQLNISAQQISNKVGEVQEASKSEAERLGHSVTSLISYFDPMVSNAIGTASNMVSSKQQVLILDQTKTVAECAQQLLYAAKESGGNPRATHVHGDIDESADAMIASLQEMQASVEKLAPNMGVVSSIVNCISEAIIQVDDYRPGSRNDTEEGLATFQSRMMTSTKEIAKTAQEIVIKSSSDPSQLGGLANDISGNYQNLASDTRGAIHNTQNTEVANRIKSSVQDLGQVTIELVKSTGSCQMAQNDSFVLRDVSETARKVGEKCSNVLSSLNALARGTHALENAANTVSGILGDLDTTIMFATAGTLNADTDEEVFADHREHILKTAKALVEDTKTLVAGAASSQEQLAVAAQNAVTTIVQLSDVVKNGATSLGSQNQEAQVMLINAVKDVTSALGDLMQATKSASGKNMQHPAMHTLKDAAKIMVTNVTSLLKTVKAVEDEHTRGTRALESTIEAIAQEIRSFDSQEAPRGNAGPEDLMRATRPITIATSKAVAAGKSCKQDDVIVAANMGRKAISDMLNTCKSAAYCAETEDLRQQSLQAGHDVGVQFRELLQLVMHILNKPTAEAKNNLPNISRKIAQCVTVLAQTAEMLKGQDWVDPDDPMLIAENELLGAAQSIEKAAKKLSTLKPRKEISSQKINDEDMKFDDMILEAAKSIANATAALIKAASEAQKELVAQGKVQKRTHIASEDGQWSEGLVSAARLVAAATHNLCEAANSLVQGNSSEEKLIAAAKQVSAATAQLLVACKVKADPDSLTMKRLEAASNAVRRATDELVKAAQGAIERNEEEALDVNTSAGTVNIIAEEVEARETVARMEKQLRDAQRRLEGVHKKKYNKSRGTDSETDQSGYESSGYDYSAPSPGATYTSFRQVYNNPGLRGNVSNTNVSYHSETEITPSANGSGNDSSIEAGPSFNESLQRFKTASGHNQQLASWKSQMQSSSSRQSSVQRRVEETRTMITQSSQKSYHIE